MGVPKKHHSKSKVGRRRSQLALKSTPVYPCQECKAPTLAHRKCIQCGKHRTNTKEQEKS